MFSLSIGALPLRAQRPTQPSDPVGLPTEQQRFVAAMLEAFEPGHRDRWQGGFELADRLGAVAVPPLRHLLVAEAADFRVRLLILAAIGAAGGQDADTELLAALTRRGAGDRERFLAGVVLAAGPNRSRAAPEFEPLLRQRLAPIVEAAALLALHRFSGGAAVPDRAYESKEPAVAAAARLVRPRPPLREERREHAQLVQRAEFLGDAPRAFNPTDARRLSELFARSDPASRPLRLAAAMWLATVADPRAWVGREVTLPAEAEVLAVLSSSFGWREELSKRNLLQPPADRVDPEWRARVALAFVLGANPAEFERVRQRWARDPGVAAVASLGVAWRLSHEGVREVPAWVVHLPDHPAREWIRVACGRAPRSRERRIGVPQLDLLLGNFDDERLVALESTRVLELTEDALATLRAHFGAIRRDLELDLIRDLLIAGSNHAAAVLGIPEDPRVRYRPGGIPPGDEVFEIAFEYWTFVKERARRPRPSTRLR